MTTTRFEAWCLDHFGEATWSQWQDSKLGGDFEACWQAALLSAHSVPMEGWKAVPIEPTAQMLDAGRNAGDFHIMHYDGTDKPGTPRYSLGKSWEAMLNAAPAPAEPLQRLAEAQRPLPADMAKVLNDNLPDLYSTDVQAEPKGGQQAIADKPQDTAVYQSIANNYARDLKPEQHRALSEQTITEAVKKWFPDRAYQAPFFARALLAASSPECGSAHTDDEAVDRFAAAMKEKLARARAKGRSGWESMDPANLSRMLREHVEKGDPRDVANFCMMLWHHSATISAPARPAQPVQDERGALTKERIAKIAADFYDAGDGDTEHGCFDIDGFADALARASASPAPSGDAREVLPTLKRVALIREALAHVKQVYSPECNEMATRREYVEDAVAQLIDAGYRIDRGSEK